MSTYFTNGMAQISVSANGTLAFVPEKEGRANSEIIWLDRAGKISTTLPAARRRTDIKLSPDGRRLAVTIEDENRNIWVHDFERGTLAPVTSGPASEFAPVWTPAGRPLAFAFERPVFQIFIKPPELRCRARRTVAHPAPGSGRARGLDTCRAHLVRRAEEEIRAALINPPAIEGHGAT